MQRTKGATITHVDRDGSIKDVITDPSYEDDMSQRWDVPVILALIIAAGLIWLVLL